MRTGKGRSEGQAFHRRLLSEYNTDFTLNNYVAYFELKPIAKELEQLCKEIERVREIEARAAAADTSTASETEDVFANQPEAMKLPQTGGSSLRPKRSLDELLKRRSELEVKFFKDIQLSFTKVKQYQQCLEADLLAGVEELKNMSEEEIRARPEEHIPKLYVKTQAILQYRALNLAALRKILKKFMQRCARDSLKLQKHLLMVDKVISCSTISQPANDLRRVALDLIAFYGTVFRLTYEETVEVLTRYEHRAGVNVRRILPHSDTFFFTLRLPHQERHGDFAVCILPGSTSLFCEKMICEVLQCNRYPPCCGQYPNGEVNVVLPRSVRGDDLFVLQSLVRCDRVGLSHSGTLMELALMIHAARASSAARITAVIPYISFTESVSSMAAVAEILESMGCQHVITVDMPIDQVEGMFSVPLELISARYEFVQYIANQLTAEGHDFRNITVVAPNGAGVHRAKNFADALMQYKKLSPDEQFVPLCTAVRRQVYRGLQDTVLNINHCGANVGSTRAFEQALLQQEQGICAIQDDGDTTITSEGIDLVGDVQGKLCIVVDTSVDEATEICQTACKLREEGASRIILIATHFIISGRAVERLIESPIDLIVVTDSVEHDEVFKNPHIARRLRVLPIAPLLARAIEKLHTENSLTTLFEK
ncbi:ribose-phosphate pyrophosphokinase, putative [Trypanosoma brucei gambiense DAL972]|uniref:Ribose-phosphate pyrophosphokinase, putative n=2 Tax=Trypanosoma brucei TaxID=5691 RepID=C9ZPH5_TRYB9|nr:ribose-phosphate pyrophosphokinase, putative [Trypanosoma brucei gambiense DAL972]RHW72296.1 ribose-phosphate pyrophosphokinase [Trypanosoma brucei equiperdum]CBH11303.1 ribose-phosphate pyrophosphokinase, putative [Trypanosoma brucei gambiense DAL972]|eukprot:XP_011773590.1 ribose-phosphate pyrophosphokinase, putative [Trypanosoma brucei gambiense DAL972]